MNHPDPLDAMLEELRLDLDELCRQAGVESTWVCARVDDGLLTLCESGTAIETWRFDAAGLRRVRRMVCLERDFDAVPELAALVADLEDEVRALRERLQRIGG
ncbi:MAG: MerR family transcriptional regulator [Aquabacterium sp.]|jgi:chaperone modulatory protein CbpM|nr:MAG: MerR family transcriptional regulator [Aquabacterium sp.]TAL21290.1 MAG: MerR family transcriptional regulator [Aquabacterium sp.]